MTGVNTKAWGTIKRGGTSSKGAFILITYYRFSTMKVLVYASLV